MASTPLILSIDQGTTSSRALVFNPEGEIVSLAQCEFRQYFPKPGWVEHAPEDIWRTTLQTAQDAITAAEQRSGGKVECIGITNQRETTIAWDKRTGNALGNAIVWQDRRTADYCEALRSSGKVDEIVHRTGLTIDPYFSATKLRWILENVEGASELAAQGLLAFGTVDAFLIFRLTGGRHHLTDETNASRTLLYNINNGVDTNTCT